MVQVQVRAGTRARVSRTSQAAAMAAVVVPRPVPSRLPDQGKSGHWKEVISLDLRPAATDQEQAELKLILVGLP